MKKTEKIQMIIVDDNPIFLEGITSYLRKNDLHNIVAVFASGSELIEAIKQYDPDVVLLDIEMPWLNGIETARRLGSYGMKLKLIGITMYQDCIYIKNLKEAGFMGFVNKNQVTENLNHVIAGVINGNYMFPDN